MSSSVVVTGLGTIGPAGAGREALAAALCAGSVPLSEVDRSSGYHLPGSARLAGLVPEGTTDPWLPKGMARRMSPCSRMAVAAARMAIEDANLAQDAVAGTGTAVCLGTAFGSTSYTARLLRQLDELGPLGISPLLFTETVASAHSGQIALAFGAQGPNHAISAREASDLLAVGRGAALVASGSVERALVGTVDETSPLLHAVLDRFGALARADEDGRELARVFDAQRAGFVTSEGATVLVLEEEQAARDRGAPLLARVRATVRANDPTATVSDWGHGHEGLAAALARQLERLGLPPSSMDRIISGASGSVRGDRLEALTLRALYRDSGLPQVVAPKSLTGEYGGGFLAAAILVLGGVDLAATPGFEEVDEELGVIPHDGSPLPAAERLIVSSLAAGGAAAWLILEGGLT